MILDLPYPPSNNRYYRHFHGRTVLSKEGRNYRWEVLAARPRDGWPIPGPVKVVICIFPPTRWGIDIDGAAKAPLDAIQNAGIIANDREVAELLILRGPKRPIPRLFVLIETLHAESGAVTLPP